MRTIGLTAALALLAAGFALSPRPQSASSPLSAARRESAAPSVASARVVPVVGATADDADELFRLRCEADWDGALTWALQLRADWPTRRRIFQILAATGVRQNWRGTLDALAHLPENEAKDELRLAIGHEVARVAPREALRLALEFPPNIHRDRLAARAIAEWAAVEPAAAAVWAQELSPSEFRDRVTAALCTVWAESDALAAADCALHAIAAGERQDRALVGIVQRWAQRDPETAAAIVAKFPTGDLQEAAAEALLPIWAAHSRAAVATWLDGLPSGPLREHSMAVFGRMISQRPTP